MHLLLVLAFVVGFVFGIALSLWRGLSAVTLDVESNPQGQRTARG
jgi:hypothetical protein